MLYTSIDNEKIKQLRKLRLKKYRDESNLFMVEGSHLVLEAYKTGHLKELLLEQDTVFPLSVETHYINKEIVNYLTTLQSPSNIFGVSEKKKTVEKIGNRVLIVDNIQDPGNLGTIIRSAVAFSVDTIILSNNTVDIYNPKVVRATQGLFFHIDIIYADLKKEIPKLKEDGYKIVATKVTHGKNIKSIEKKEKLAIIVGNEGSGVSEELIDLSDEYVFIEMSSVCESLNVGVATSIILYELDK